MYDSHVPYRIEPLGEHDRSAFCCGISDLDQYLYYQAGQDARRKVAAPFVLINSASAILGYYTLSAYSVRVDELPATIAKKLPRYPLIPATLLGRLAVHRQHQGLKLGRVLLVDALHRAWKATAQVASVGVVAETINDAAQRFYLRHNFVAIRENPNKVFLAMMTIQKLFL